MPQSSAHAEGAAADSYYTHSIGTAGDFCGVLHNALDDCGLKWQVRETDGAIEASTFFHGTNPALSVRGVVLARFRRA